MSHTPFNPYVRRSRAKRRVKHEYVKISRNAGAAADRARLRRELDRKIIRVIEEIENVTY